MADTSDLLSRKPTKGRSGEDVIDPDVRSSLLLSSSEKSQRLKVICRNTNIRNIAIFIAIYASAAVAGGIALPLLGASWLGGCLASDGFTIVTDDCDPDYRSFSFLYTLFVSLNGLMIFLFSSFLGRLSDSFGRKLFIGLCLLTHLIPRIYIIFHVQLLIYLVLSIIMDAPTSVYQAAVSDTFPESKSLKTVAFAILLAMPGVGLFVGAIIALIVSAAYSNHAVFVAIGGLYLFAVFWWIFCIKETLPKERRIPFQTKNYNPFRPLFHVMDNRIVTYCSIHALLFSFDQDTVLALIIGFAGDQFDIEGDVESNAVFAALSVMGGLGTIMNGAVLMPLLKRAKIRNIFIMIFADIIRIIGLLFIAISPVIFRLRFILSITGTFLLGIGSISRPCRTGIAAHHLVQCEQGIGLGIIASYESVGKIVAPGAMGWIYYEFTRNEGSWMYIPSMPWYICIAAKVISLVIVSGPFYSLVMREGDRKGYVSNVDLKVVDDAEEKCDRTSSVIEMNT